MNNIKTTLLLLSTVLAFGVLGLGCEKVSDGEGDALAESSLGESAAATSTPTPSPTATPGATPSATATPTPVPSLVMKPDGNLSIASDGTIAVVSLEGAQGAVTWSVEYPTRGVLLQSSNSSATYERRGTGDNAIGASDSAGRTVFKVVKQP